MVWPANVKLDNSATTELDYAKCNEVYVEPICNIMPSKKLSRTTEKSMSSSTSVVLTEGTALNINFFVVCSLSFEQ